MWYDINMEKDLEKKIKEEEIQDEDEMVIADMSLVRKRRAFLPDRIRHEDRLMSGGGESDLQLSDEETKWAILGTLKAALLIGGAYAIGLGAIILLMVILFKNFG